jgi:hypothetical protein
MLVGSKRERESRRAEIIGGERVLDLKGRRSPNIQTNGSYARRLIACSLALTMSLSSRKWNYKRWQTIHFEEWRWK